MLVLSRKPGESIVIDGGVVVTVLDIGRGRVQVGIARAARNAGGSAGMFGRPQAAGHSGGAEIAAPQPNVRGGVARERLVPTVNC